MKGVSTLVAFLAVVGVCTALRAFPQESKEMTQDLFQQINPNIRPDDTNFLIDTAGPFANCPFLHQDGSFEVNEKTPNGGSIGGLRDTYPGEEAHWGAVQEYIRGAMQHWIRDEPYRGQIKQATSYGCSVQPACRDRRGGGRQLSIACVFSPAYDQWQGEEGDGELALAFTPQQYIVAETILNVDWDLSHELENMSGKFTNCAMINNPNVPLTSSNKDEREKLAQLGRLAGTHPNEGSTQRAMEEIMLGWDDATVRKVAAGTGSKIGCSVIPDCKLGGQMHVVVSCLYEEA